MYHDQRTFDRKCIYCLDHCVKKRSGFRSRNTGSVLVPCSTAKNLFKTTYRSPVCIRNRIRIAICKPRFNLDLIRYETLCFAWVWTRTITNGFFNRGLKSAWVSTFYCLGVGRRGAVGKETCSQNFVLAARHATDLLHLNKKLIGREHRKEIVNPLSKDGNPY
jgi:hypothetical protein